MQKIVIIGGMAAGCKTASRLKRIDKNANVTIIEKNKFISYGTCGMPFFASGDIDSFNELAMTPYGVVRDNDFFKKVKDVNVITNKKVTQIDNESKIVYYEDVDSKDNDRIEYDKLVISTGASAIEAPFKCPECPEVTNFHSPLDALHFRKRAQNGEVGSVVIIGGGYIGVELAEAMVSLWGIDTKLIELQERLLPKSLDKEMSGFLEKALDKNGIDILLKIKVERIEKIGDKIKVFLDDESVLETDHVFLCIGIKPNIELASSIGCEIGKHGGISTDSRLMTTVDGVYSAGDCIETKNLVTGRPDHFPLGSLANRQGRIVAENLADLDSRFRGSVGTISLKVFDLITASAGITSSRATELGYDFCEVAGAWYDRPDYMPEVYNIAAKMIFERETQRLLGIQIVGQGEVTRYIDTFSSLLLQNAHIQDLIDHEHAYTPTHSGPINILNNLGYMAMARIHDKLFSVNYEDGFDSILDVREQHEVNEDPLALDSINIPLGELRSRINEIPKGKVLVFCQKGPRSYEAAKILVQNGFNHVEYRAGGILFREHAL